MRRTSQQMEGYRSTRKYSESFSESDNCNVSVKHSTPDGNRNKLSCRCTDNHNMARIPLNVNNNFTTICITLEVVLP